MSVSLPPSKDSKNPPAPASNHNPDTRKTAYLDSVRFDPALVNKPWAQYITNIRWVLLLILLIAGVGVSSFFTLPTRLNPEVKIPVVQVTTVLPGASPQDIESLITDPLEAQLAGIEGLNTISSISQENVSVITLEFQSRVDRDKARQDTQAAVDSVSSLPDDAEAPRVRTLDFEDTPIWQFALVAKDAADPTLFTFARQLKKAIEGSSRIDRVVMSGEERQEIQVIIQPEKAQAFDVQPNQLLGSVRAAASSFPAGTVRTDSAAFSLSIDPQVLSVSDLRNLRITVEGKVVRLGDIAEVSLRSADSQAKAFFAASEGEPLRAVTFAVYKTSSSDIDDASQEVQALVARELEPRADSFEVRSILNTADEITEQFSDLLINFRDTIFLVFLVLVLFLGLRQALIACFTIPLTFLASFAFMQAFDLSINFLSLFSLLLSLGLLIDDTVVVVQAMTAYHHTNRFTPQQTGILVWRDFIVPIWSTTITTVWAFAPLLLAGGIIGEFIKSIPLVVSFTLISSTAIAVLVTLPLMIFLLKPRIPTRVRVAFQAVLALSFIAVIMALSPRNLFLPLILAGFVLLFVVIRTAGRLIVQRLVERAKLRRIVKAPVWRYIRHGLANGFIDMGPVDNLYKRGITRIISSRRWRRTVVAMVVLFSLFSYTLLPAGMVENVFFPKSDNQQLFVNLELPAGTSLERTNIEAYKLVRLLQKTPGLDYLTGVAGQAFGGRTSFEPNGGANTATFTLNLKEDRAMDSMTIASKLRRDFGLYEPGRVTIIEVSGGPPAGADLELSILGDDLRVLDEIANKVAAYLEDQPGVQNIEKSIKPGTSRLVFVPDYSRIAEEGVSQAEIGQQLRAFASGLALETIPIEGEDYDIVYRFGNDAATPQDLSGLQIQTRNGFVPLTSLGTLRLSTNPTRIVRENQKRAMTISASVAAGYNNVAINQQLQKHIQSIQLPSGYAWKTGGVNEENARSVQSILQAMLLAFLLIFGTMVLQFGSFRQALLVLLVIPLAVSGVFVIFALTGTPLSFPALIGVLALFGIVVNNSMVIIDKINMNLREGLRLIDAIADAAANRLEPILLTSLLTMIGLAPITVSDPLWQGLGGAIIAGLTVSGAIMLFFIPVVYYMWFRDEREGSIETTQPQTPRSRGTLDRT